MPRAQKARHVQFTRLLRLRLGQGNIKATNAIVRAGSDIQTSTKVARERSRVHDGVVARRRRRAGGAIADVAGIGVSSAARIGFRHRNSHSR